MEVGDVGPKNQCSCEIKEKILVVSVVITKEHPKFWGIRVVALGEQKKTQGGAISQALIYLHNPHTASE